jgi:dihydroorotase
VKDGKINRISKLRLNQSVDLKIDAKGLLALPGFIDAHVHLRDLELSYKETFETGTRAAAGGGFTTVIDMPNTKPPTVSNTRLAEKKQKAEGRLFTNLAFQGALLQDSTELRKMKDQGAVEFKLYLNKTLGTFDSSKDSELRQAFAAAKDVNALVTVHAEDGDAIRKSQQTSMRLEKRTIQDFLRAHAPRFETSEIHRILKLSADSGARIHICHVSVPESVQAIRKAPRATCEVTPHHLLLNHSIFKSQGTRAVCVPPIRNEKDRRRLWTFFSRGKIQMLASDHAPHTLEEKTSNVWGSPPGIVGLETSLPLMFSQIVKGRLSLKRLVDAAATSPARIFQLRGKGRLEKGFDADIILVNPKKTTTIRAANFNSKAKFSPFEGTKCKGDVSYTIVNGQIVAHERTIVGSACGRILNSTCDSS